MKITQLIIAPLAIMISTTFASAKVINNIEIQKLLTAEMSEDIILTVITTAKDKDFDTSADALTALKKQGATPAIIKAMLGSPVSMATTAPASTAGVETTDAWEPNDVYTVVDGKIEQLNYAPAEIRYATRALGLGGAGAYAVLHGSNAERTTSTKPVFLVAVPKNVQAASYFTLANFAVRPNGDREVLIGSANAIGSMRVGIVKNRVIPLTATKAADQSKAGKNTVVYEITPTNTLNAGQYALVANLVASGLGQMSGNYYDFQVK